MLELIGLLAAVLVLTVVAVVALVSGRGRRSLPKAAPKPGIDYRPGTGDDAEVPRDTPLRTVDVVDLPDVLPDETQSVAPVLDVPDPTAGRLTRLRSRLSRSQSTIGRGLFALLSRDVLDEDTWEEVEDTLLGADMGVAATTELVQRLRTRVRVDGVRTTSELRPMLREELVTAIGRDADRSLRTVPHEDGSPSVVLVVGVNGTGKTTTCGKLARVLVADGRSVLLGAADTFRAAAADQLQTWGSRVGADVVRGPEGGDPASVAFDAVAQGRRGPSTRCSSTRPAGCTPRAASWTSSARSSGSSRSTARSTRRCSCWTRPRARTASCRPACSPRPSRSPASC